MANALRTAFPKAKFLGPYRVWDLEIVGYTDDEKTVILRDTFLKYLAANDWPAFVALVGMDCIISAKIRVLKSSDYMRTKQLLKMKGIDLG